MSTNNLVRWVVTVGLMLLLAMPAQAATVDVSRSSDVIGISIAGNRDTAGWEYGGGLLMHDDDGRVLAGEMHYVNVPNPGRVRCSLA